MTDAPRHVALYFRVSSDAQDIASQRAGVYAKAAELFPGVDTVEFTDEGVSAYHNPLPSRPGSGAMLDAVEAGDVLAVVCDSQDRLSRGDEMEMQLFLDACRRNDTRLITVTGGEARLGDEDATFATRLVSMAASYTARREAREKAHRSKRGRVAAAEQGRWPGGPPPPGYHRRSDGILELDDVAPLVAELFRLFDAGIGVMELARRMEALTGDVRWTRQRVGDALDNPTYIGRILNDGVLYEGLHEPLVDGDLWESVRELRDGAKASNRRQTRVQPFSSSILRCGDCGGPLKPHPDRREHGYLDYECRACRTRHRGEYVELAYIAVLAATHDRLMTQLSDPSVGVRADQDVELTRAELTELRRHMKNLLPLVEDGDKDAIERHRDLQAQAQAAEKAISRMSAETGERRSELEALRDRLEAFAGSGPAIDTPIESRLIRSWLASPVIERVALVTAVAERVEAFDHGELTVKLRALARPVAVDLRRTSRHSPESKALREVGFGALSPS
jgi:site-specific DNA recombinase